jgi:hypothetical protein
VQKSFGNEAINALVKLSVLSDEGLGIKKFCDDNHIKQFFCFRHLINKFGPGTNIAILVAKILFTQTKAEFEIEHAVNFTIAKKIFALDPRHLQAFEKLFGEKLVQNKETKIWTWVKVDNTYDEQALWARNKDHISTCSNHAERFHRTLKSRLKQVSTMGEQAHVFRHEIYTKSIEFGCPGKSRMQLRRWMTKQEKKKLDSKREYIQIPMTAKCTHCLRIDTIRARFQYQCPCIHQIDDYHALDMKIEDNLAVNTEYEQSIPTVEKEEQENWLLPEKKTTGAKKTKIPFIFEDLENDTAVICSEVKDLPRVVRTIWNPFPFPALASTLQIYWGHYVSFHPGSEVSGDTLIELWSTFVLWIWDAARAKKMTLLGYQEGQMTIWNLLARKQQAAAAPEPICRSHKLPVKSPPGFIDSSDTSSAESMLSDSTSDGFKET